MWLIKFPPPHQGLWNFRRTPQEQRKQLKFIHSRSGTQVRLLINSCCKAFYSPAFPSIPQTTPYPSKSSQKILISTGRHDSLGTIIVVISHIGINFCCLQPKNDNQSISGMWHRTQILVTSTFRTFSLFIPHILMRLFGKSVGVKVVRL